MKNELSYGTVILAKSAAASALLHAKDHNALAGVNTEELALKLGERSVDLCAPFAEAMSHEEMDKIPFGISTETFKWVVNYVGVLLVREIFPEIPTENLQPNVKFQQDLQPGEVGARLAEMEAASLGWPDPGEMN